MKKAPLSQQHVQDAEQVVVMDSNKDLERLEQAKTRGEKNLSFHCQDVLLPSSNLCNCSCTLCQHVQKARLVWDFFSATHPTPKFFLFVALHQAQDLRL